MHNSHPEEVTVEAPMPRILIVDDDASTRKSMGLILRRRGYRTEEAESGRAAIQKVSGAEFDVALVDIRLPDVLGTELFRQLQALQTHLAVIIVTGYASVQSAVEALKRGAAAYITKPVNMDEVLAEIEDCLEKQRLSRENGRLTEALRKSEEEYRELVEGANSIILRCKADGTVTFLNAYALAFFGFAPDEILGRNMVGRIVPATDLGGDDLAELVRRTGRDPDTQTVTECEHLRRDGERVWVTWQNRALRNEDGSIREILCVGIDSTARRQAERTARRTHRSLVTLRRCGEALVRAHDEQDLLADICRLLVQSGSYRIAWTGFARDAREERLEPVAWAGASRESLGRIDTAWTHGTDNGSRIAGIRRHAPTICRYLRDDPGVESLGAEARALGCASAIALPLHADNGVRGGLFLYAAEPDVFEDPEVRLLMEFAEELAYGLSALRARAERQRLQNEVLKIGEEEQRRIGRDLHDSVGQQLTGIAHRLDLLEEQLLQHDPTEAGQAAEIRQLLDQAIDQVRSLSHLLHPVRASSHGLDEALEELAAWSEKHLGIPCAFECAGPLRLAQDGFAVHLFRIAQEAVNNAAKHAKPSRIEIRLRREAGAVCLEIDDDGQGLPHNNRPCPGLGLRIMHYRAEALGGALHIRARKEGGTSVACTVPLGKLTRKKGWTHDHESAASTGHLSRAYPSGR